MTFRKKPIEIAFSTVRKNKGIKRLTSGQYGAFIAICQAALEDGQYPLPVAAPRVMAVLAKTTRPNWYDYRHVLLPLLDELLPGLYTLYQEEKALQKIRSDRTRRNLAKVHEKMRLAKSFGPQNKKCGTQVPQCGIQIPKPEAIMLSEQSHDPVPLQPFKAPPKRSKSYDNQAVTEATRYKLRDKVKRLTD